MARNLIILGAGGGVCDALDVVDAINAREETWKVVGLLDDAARGERFGIPILGDLKKASGFRDFLFISCIRSEASFTSTAKLIGSLGLPRESFATLIHPQSAVSPRTVIGAGVHVNFGVSVGGGAAIEDHAFLGPGCILGHDSVIRSNATIAAGAVISGRVTVEANCYVGTGAIIRQSLTIGSGSLVGMGAVVIKSVPPRSVVAGNPAKVLRTLETPSKV